MFLTATYLNPTLTRVQLFTFSKRERVTIKSHCPTVAGEYEPVYNPTAGTKQRMQGPSSLAH